jgi:hypothetical protein
MNHTTCIPFHQHISYKSKNVVAILMFLLLAITACKKENIAGEQFTRQASPSVKVKNALMLERIVFNDTVVKLRTINNLKQIGLAVHNFDDGSLKKEIAYEYDQAGRLLKATIKSKGHYAYEHDPAGLIRRSSFYPENFTSPAFTAEYEYNASSDLAQWRTNFGNSGASAAPGGAGDDILIGGRTTYEYNKDGSVRSIAVFANHVDKEPIGKVNFQYNATPARIGAWKVIVDPYPEPEKPWDIITLLCTRIEMHGKGTVAGEEIIDGKIIEARNMIYSRDGFLLSKKLKVITPGSGATGATIRDFSVQVSYTGLE